jgi:histidine triad (HIT) family protein
MEGVMNPWIKRIILKGANWKIKQKIISRAVIHSPRLIPFTPLRESSYWIVYVHPTPVYPVHLIILPKIVIKNWMTLTVEDGKLFGDFIQLTQEMIRDFELEPAGYRLILNGGPNQTFPHLHFHRIAGDPLPQKNEE